MPLDDEELVRSPLPLCRCRTRDIHDGIDCLIFDFQRMKIEEDLFRYKIVYSNCIPGTGVAKVTYLVSVPRRVLEEEICNLVVQLFEDVSERFFGFEYCALMARLGDKNFHLVSGSVQAWVNMWFPFVQPKFSISMHIFAW